jgi:hypothetical protein
MDPVAVEISEATPINVASRAATLTVPAIDLRKLLLACPFLRPELRTEIQNGPAESNGLPLFFRSVSFNEARSSLQLA